MHFQIEIADTVIELNTIYDSTYRMCQDYLCSDREPQISIEICEEDILHERQINRKMEMEEGQPETDYFDDYLETLAVYRKICSALLDFDCFLMHGSVIASPASDTDRDAAVMFTARSGVGKTTRTLMWLDQIEGSYVVNGDKPILKITEGEVLACGTPWAGKEQLQRNCKVPLKAIFILERGEENTIEELSFSTALPLLIPQIYRSGRSDELIKTLKLLNKLGRSVKVFRLCSNLDKEVIDLAYQAYT